MFAGSFLEARYLLTEHTERPVAVFPGCSHLQGNTLRQFPIRNHADPGLLLHLSTAIEAKAHNSFQFRTQLSYRGASARSSVVPQIPICKMKVILLCVIEMLQGRT